MILILVLSAACTESAHGPALELVAHVEYEMGGDIQFQRRSGTHTVDGVLVDITTDLVFASAHSDRSRDDGGIRVVDITDPAEPVELARIPCPGYQSDVAVHETLLVQTIDFPESNQGCDPSWLDASGSREVDRARVGGVRVFDVSDPARPRLIGFVEVGEGAHNVTVIPWSDIAYVAELDGDLGVLDLADPAFTYAAIDVRSISPEMKTSCHDFGLDPLRLLAFCPATLDETYILDVSEPTRPAYLGKIVNAALSRHHGARMAPDGVTLVLEAEFDHEPDVPSDAPAGLWFYDLTESTDPMLLGSWAPSSCEPSELAERACSSHWYNFVPGSKSLVVAWRHEGVFVVDYTDPAAVTEAGFFRPSSFRPGANPDFWTAYFWHGHLYATSGADLSGLYILGKDDFADSTPSPYDEGTSWGRWTTREP